MKLPDPEEVRNRTGPCYSKICGHQKSDHAEPLREDGHCRVSGCACSGWDPMTEEEWKVVMESTR